MVLIFGMSTILCLKVEFSRSVFQSASDIIVDEREDDSLEEISSDSGKCIHNNLRKRYFAISIAIKHQNRWLAWFLLANYSSIIFNIHIISMYYVAYTYVILF